jgi:hypothetical protein
MKLLMPCVMDESPCHIRCIWHVSTMTKLAEEM